MSQATECVPQAAHKKNTLACQACAKKKRLCVSVAQLQMELDGMAPAPAHEDDPSIPSTSAPAANPAAKSVKRCSTAGKSRSLFGLNTFITFPTAKNENIEALLHTILSTIQTDGQEMRDRLYNLEVLTRAICVQANVVPAGLPLRRPAVPLFNAPSPSPSIISTSTPSAISSTSSSSAVHVPRMEYMNHPSSGALSSGSAGLFQREQS